MNWEKILLLLQVVHSASEAGPRFAKFASQAAQELEQEWLEAHPAPEPSPAQELDDEPKPLRRL
jgi:hypothetical protein